MDSNKLFTVKTTIEQKDYHKFLYIATFFKRKVYPLILFIFTAILSLLVTYNEGCFSPKEFLVFWIILNIFLILVIVIKIEIIFRQRIKTDNTGFFNSTEILDFYTDFLIVKSKVFEGEMKIKYNQIYKIFESKDYFIFYFNINNATLIRKDDLEKEIINNLSYIFKNNLKNNYKTLNI